MEHGKISTIHLWMAFRKTYFRYISLSRYIIYVYIHSEQRENIVFMMHKFFFHTSGQQDPKEADFLSKIPQNITTNCGILKNQGQNFSTIILTGEKNPYV